VPIVRRPSATRPVKIRVIDFIVIVPLTGRSSAILLAGNNFQFRCPIREPDVWNLAVPARNELVASAFVVDVNEYREKAESLKVTRRQPVFGETVKSWRQIWRQRPILPLKTPAPSRPVYGFVLKTGLLKCPYSAFQDVLTLGETR
jgi:hypothetical protein